MFFLFSRAIFQASGRFHNINPDTLLLVSSDGKHAQFDKSNTFLQTFQHYLGKCPDKFETTAQQK